MASASDTASSARRTNTPKIKEEWKRNMWKQRTAARLLAQDDQMIKLKSKEKGSSKVCSVHRALLCFYSPYHDRLLNGDFAEGLVAPTEPLFVNAGASVLKLLLTWLYTGKFDVANVVNQCRTGISKLYILADELNCVALQRSIMSKLVESCKNTEGVVGLDAIGLLSNSSLESSGLYQYCVEAFDAHRDGTFDGESREDLKAEDPMPPHFAYRLLLRRSETLEDDGAQCVCCHDPCKYHGHENEGERKATCGAPNVEFEDDLEEDLDFDSESDSESESESDTELQSTLRNKSAGKKRSHKDEDADTSKMKRIKTT
ncbi:hypothetical protein KCU91_g13110, partial [Aureobasidium melanogenum]